MNVSYRSGVSIVESDPNILDDRYVVRRELGRGGVCVVHEAMHRFTERLVAIKTLLPEFQRSEEAQIRLLQEATALGRTRHPCVVEALDAGRSRGLPYLVMELLEGGRSLEGLLASRGKLPVRDAAQIIRRIAEGVAAAHAAGVVHRDIKPGNVILMKRPSPDDPTKSQTFVKVIDFGLATLIRDREKQLKISLAETILGTPEYMPLERLTATDDRKPVTDVYALGITFYECLAGTVPYSGSYPQVLQLVATTTAGLVSRVRPDVPEEIAMVIHKAISREPQDRYPDARAFCEALDRALAKVAPPSVPGVTRFENDVAPPVDPESAKRRFRRAPYITPVRLTLDGESFDGRSEDMSEGGILVMAPRSARLGSTGEIRFALPATGELVTAKMLLRWAKENKDHPRAPCALGIELVNPEERIRKAIATYVDIVAPPTVDWIAQAPQKNVSK